MKDSIAKILVNFLNNQSNIEELEFLLNWIEDSENFKSFKQFITVHHFSNWAMNQADQEKIIVEIKNKIKSQKLKESNTSYRYLKPSKYAAIIRSEEHTSEL